MRFLAVVALLVLSVGGCWFATQYVASALAYAPALGPPWATLGERAPLRSVAVDRLGPALRAACPDRLSQRRRHDIARRPRRCGRGRDGGAAPQAFGQ